MAPNLDFESQSFNFFSFNEEFQNNEISSLDTKYYVPGEGKDQLKSLHLNSLSVLHLNIRSMKKHFEASQDFIEFSIKFQNFKIQNQISKSVQSAFQNLASTSQNFRFKLSATRIL